MANKIDKYEVIKEIGAGGFGTVYLVESEGKRYALKQLSKNNMEPEITERFIREALRVEELRKNYHIDFLVKIYDVLFKQNAFVMEFIPEDSIGYFKKSRDLEFISLLIQAILQLHNIGVVHRDIKPENLRVKESRPVLIDFGIASWWDSRSKIIPTGTKFYSPPEIVCIFDEFKRLKAARDANKKLVDILPGDAKERIRHIKKLHDVYSLGITIGELFNGSLPFNRNSYVAYLDRGGSPDFDNWLSGIPKQYREFIGCATEFYPDKRRQLPDLVENMGMVMDFDDHAVPEVQDDLYFQEGVIECLGCGKKTMPPANFCPYCALPLGSLGLEIIPFQSVSTHSLPRSVTITETASDGVKTHRLSVDLEGQDFEISLGRNGELNQVCFIDDNWMSNVHGSLVKEAEHVFFQEGKDGRLPTNPTLINNIPVGKTKIELFSGGFLLMGSTVFNIKKYFGKMQAGSR